jgi:hypothetical protein
LNTWEYGSFSFIGPLGGQLSRRVGPALRLGKVGVDWEDHRVSGNGAEYAEATARAQQTSCAGRFPSRNISFPCARSTTEGVPYIALTGGSAKLLPRGFRTDCPLSGLRRQLIL